MNRLQKFIEHGSGQKPGRTAYAFGSASLPEPSVGMDWRAVSSFNAADELLQNEGLKEVFKTAIAKGYAIVQIG